MDNSNFYIPILAKHLNVSPSYLYKLLRRGTLKPASQTPLSVDQQSLTDFYSKRIPTAIFNLTLKQD